MLFHLISQVQHVRDDSKGSSSGGNGKKKPIVTTGKFCEQKFCSFIQKEEGGRMEGKKKESVAFSREKIMAGVQKIQGLPCAFIFPKIILITFPSNCHRHTCEGLLPVKSRSQRVHKFLSVFGCCCYHRSGHWTHWAVTEVSWEQLFVICYVEPEQIRRAMDLSSDGELPCMFNL